MAMLILITSYLFNHGTAPDLLNELSALAADVSSRCLDVSKKAVTVINTFTRVLNRQNKAPLPNACAGQHNRLSNEEEIAIEQQLKRDLVPIQNELRALQELNTTLLPKITRVRNVFNQQTIKQMQDNYNKAKVNLDIIVNNVLRLNQTLDNRIELLSPIPS